MESLTPLHGKVALALAVAFSAAAWSTLVEPRETAPRCRTETVADLGIQPGFGDYARRAAADCTRVELPAIGD